MRHRTALLLAAVLALPVLAGKPETTTISATWEAQGRVLEVITTSAFQVVVTQSGTFTLPLHPTITVGSCLRLKGSATGHQAGDGFTWNRTVAELEELPSDACGC